jgi:hypothetical protein
MLDAANQSASHRTAVLAWRRQHEKALGAGVDTVADTQPHMSAMSLGNVVVIGGTMDASRLVLYERPGIPPALSGWIQYLCEERDGPKLGPGTSLSLRHRGTNEL